MYARVCVEQLIPKIAVHYVHTYTNVMYRYENTHTNVRMHVCVNLSYAEVATVASVLRIGSCPM